MNEPIIQHALFEPRADLDRLQRNALIVGAAGLAATTLGFFLTGGSVAFYRAYLVSWLWTLAMALGLFLMNMIQHISGGDWGVVMRRVLEASGRTLPFFVVAGVPLVLGLGEVYHHWMHPKPDDALLAHKAVYLNAPFFLARSLLYFTVWSAIAFALSSWSNRHDATGDESYKVKMQRLSAGGIVFFALSATFAAVDWIMSLDPHWFSSLFGFSFIAGNALSACAFIVPLMLFLSTRQPMDQMIGPKLFHDYGKLTLAGIMVWAYFMISQYLIIWSADLPEEITWYMDRSSSGWLSLSVLLIVCHFAIPFMLLLSADLKKRARLLVLVSAWILIMRWLDFYWQCAPSMSDEASFHWLNLTAPLGIGGLWLAVLISQFKTRNMVPVRDSALKEVLAHG